MQGKVFAFHAAERTIEARSIETCNTSKGPRASKDGQSLREAFRPAFHHEDLVRGNRRPCADVWKKKSRPSERRCTVDFRRGTKISLQEDQSPRKQVKRQAHRVAPSTSTSHSGSSTEPMPTSPGEIPSASGVSAEMPCDSSTRALRECLA